MALGLRAQTNLQEMYDFGRGHCVTTLEHFSTDDWGNTFFFTDIEHPQMSVPMGFYTEIARGINFWQDSKLGAFSLHAEWNGGNFATNAWLFGVEYFMHSEDFSRTLTLEVLYKDIKAVNASEIPMQLTAVWGVKGLFGVKRLAFSGFADFWWENTNWGSTTTQCVFLSEPQLWYGVNNHLNVGGEVEIAYNFAGGHFSGMEFYRNQGWTVAPAAGIKWVF